MQASTPTYHVPILMMLLLVRDRGRVEAGRRSHWAVMASAARTAVIVALILNSFAGEGSRALALIACIGQLPVLCCGSSRNHPRRPPQHT